MRCLHNQAQKPNEEFLLAMDIILVVSGDLAGLSEVTVESDSQSTKRKLSICTIGLTVSVCD